MYPDGYLKRGLEKLPRVRIVLVSYAGAGRQSDFSHTGEQQFRAAAEEAMRYGEVGWRHRQFHPGEQDPGGRVRLRDVTFSSRSGRGL